MKIQVDTLVIGAGVIGSSVAMHLARLGAKDIRVLDFDLEGSLSSSELNAGGVRATWVQPINIQTSKISIEYYASISEQVGYRPVGYLWLHSPERLSSALKARERQTEMGWKVEAWDTAELKRRVPFIDKTDDIAGAIYAPKDGLVNPNRLKNHYREKARALGVVFDDRTLVRSAEYLEQGVALTCDQISGPLSFGARVDVFGHTSSAKKMTYQAKRVVNCAGPWAPEVAKILDYPCLSHPVRRQICIFDCRDVDLTPYGMVVDTSGVYFHPEATNGLAGFANPGEPPGYSYAYDAEKFFMETIWPALYERSSAFERLKHVTGWAGLYEVSPDESAVIGQAYRAPSEGRVYDCHSFSGHGVMHSYAAGMGLAELMIHGKYQTIDFGPLGGDRFDAGRTIHETLII